MNFEKWAKDLEMEEDEFLEMMDLFVKAISSDLQQLQSAIDEGDAQQVARTAHSIKGAAVNLGLTEIFEAAKETEMEARQDRLNRAAEIVQMLRKKLNQIQRGLDDRGKGSGRPPMQN